MTERSRSPALDVAGLSCDFLTPQGIVYALSGVDLTLYPREIHGLVGESGCGKSVTSRALLGLLDKRHARVRGRALFHDGATTRDLLTLSEDELRAVRGRGVAMIFQDPQNSLSPLETVGAQIMEAIANHASLPHDALRAHTAALLQRVGLPPETAGRYPFELSGGMQQRVMIAQALSCSPHILIADEPTTALDVTIQAQILELIRSLQAKYHLTSIYITHDLGVVARVASRIAVMYAGDIVEIGTSREVFHSPAHPYTWALLSSMPQLGVKGEGLFTIAGAPPNMAGDLAGDAFAPRNPYALKIDFEERPPFFDITPTHKARTWLLDGRAPKVEPPEAIARLSKGGK